EDSAVTALNDRRLLRRAQCGERSPAHFRFRVEPRERDKVLVEELANRAGGAAASGSEHAQTKPAHLGQQFSAAREGEDQLLAETRYTVEEGSELAIGNAEQPRRPLGDGRHDHRPTGQYVDVSGEVARFVYRDQAAAVRGVANLHPAGLDNVQIDSRLTGPKDGVAVGVVARLG